METTLYEMYMALPDPKHTSVYIRGYSEALSYIPGVRVIPDPSFYADIPFVFKQFFDPVEYPAYYVPIKVGIKHYGFIIKGQGKMSSRYSTYYPFFNLDALLRPEPYVIVTEGIKDAGIFLERGKPVLAMLTSGMSKASSQLFNEFNKVPVWAQDGDAAGDQGVRQFDRKHRNDLPTFRVRPFGHKDMGDYYDHPELRPLVEATYRKVISCCDAVAGQGTLKLLPTQGENLWV